MKEIVINNHLPEFKPGDIFNKRYQIESSFLRVKMSEVYDVIDIKTKEKVRLQILNKNLKQNERSLLMPGVKIEDNLLVKSRVKRTDTAEIYNVINTEDGTESTVLIRPSAYTVFNQLEHKALVNDTYLSMKNAFSITKDLNDERIVKIKEQGSYKNYYYLIHEFKEGVSLRNYIRSRKIGKQVPLQESIDITYLLAKTLKFLHDKKIGLYSLYPESVIVNEEGEISIWRFDEAFCLDGTKSKPLRMFKHRILNNLVEPYNSKEILENETADLREDIHLLGALAFELVYGHEPLKMRKGIPNNRLYVIGKDYNLPDWYSKFLIRSTEDNPTLRYQTIDEVMDLFNVNLASLTDKILIQRVEKKEAYFQKLEGNDCVEDIMKMSGVDDSIKHIISMSKELVEILENSVKEKISKESSVLLFETESALRSIAYRDLKIINKFHIKFHKILKLIKQPNGEDTDEWTTEILKTLIESEGYNYV